MKNLKSILCCILACTMLCFTGCEKEPEYGNTETSRVVMDNFINQEQYSILIEYEGMNYEIYYVKDGENEFLGTTVGNIQSRIIRLGTKTYNFDVVGSGKVRLVENDPTDINLAVQLLDLIYNQTVVDGKLVKSTGFLEGENHTTYDYYEYVDENGKTIEWRTAVSGERLIQATRISDSRVINFQYPAFTKDVFTLPEDYVFVDDNGNELQTGADGNLILDSTTTQE